MLKLNLHKGGKNLGSKGPGRGVGKSMKIFCQPSWSTAEGGHDGAHRESQPGTPAARAELQRGSGKSMEGCCLTSSLRLEPWLAGKTWGCYWSVGPWVGKKTWTLSREKLWQCRTCQHPCARLCHYIWPQWLSENKDHWFTSFHISGKLPFRPTLTQITQRRGFWEAAPV